MDYSSKIGTLTIKQAKEVIYKFMKAQEPILIRGQHGIGKSEIVYQAAKRLIEEGLVNKVIEKRLSQLTDGEMTGLQRVDGDFVQFTPVDWLWTACNEPVVLFLDEVDRAIRELAQGVFQLMDSRAFNGMTLHPGTIIIAAVNGGEHGSNYQVRIMDPAELDRYAVIDVRPDLTEWLEFVGEKKLVPTEISHFLAQNPEHFFAAEIERNVIQPSPRSWVKLSQFFIKNKILEKVEELGDEIVTYSRPRVGMKASIDLVKFLHNNYAKISIVDILDGKKKTSQLSTAQVYSSIEYNELLNLRSTIFEKGYNRSAVDNLTKWISELSEEVIMTAIGNIIYVLMYEPDINTKGVNSLISMFMGSLFEHKNVKSIYVKRSDELVSLDGFDFVDAIVAGCMLETNKTVDAESMLDIIISDSGMPRTTMKWEFVIEDGYTDQDYVTMKKDVEKITIKDMPTWKELSPQEKDEQRSIWAKFLRHNKKIYFGPHADNNKAMDDKTWRVNALLAHSDVKHLNIFYKDPNTNRISWFFYINDIVDEVKQHSLTEEKPMTDSILIAFNKAEVTQMYSGE